MSLFDCENRQEQEQKQRQLISRVALWALLRPFDAAQGTAVGLSARLFRGAEAPRSLPKTGKCEKQKQEQKTKAKTKAKAKDKSRSSACGEG
jgi:hypothetical protein